MARRALSPDEVKAVGLPDAAPQPTRRALAADEVAAVGLPAQPSTALEKPGAVESAGRGLAQGGTLGFSDELSGAMQAGFDRWLTRGQEVLDGKMLANPVTEWEKLKQSYIANRNAARREDAQAKEAHPAAYHIADFAGGAATGALLPVGRASSIIQGATSGLGRSESESLTGDAANAALGGVIGNYAHKFGTFLGNKFGAKAAPAISDAAEATQDKLENFAAERAVKAAGPMLKDVRNIGNIHDVRNLGSELLDRGVVEAGDNTERVAEKAMAQVSEAGAQWSKALQDLDSTTGARFNPAQAALRIEREVLGPLRGKPVFQEVVQQLEEQNARLWDIAERRGGMGFSEADALKRSYDNFVNWTREQTPYREALKQLRGILRDEIDTAAERAAASSGTDAARRFMFAKDTFKKFIPLADAAEDFTIRTLKNRFTSPSDYGVGTGAALLSNMSGANPLASMALGGAASLVHKVARERGSSTLAVAADRLAGSDWLQRMVATTPDVFGEYGGVLAQAAAQGPGSLAARDYVLTQTDPAYRAKKQEAQKAAEGRQ